MGNLLAKKDPHTEGQQNADRFMLNEIRNECRINKKNRKRLAKKNWHVVQEPIRLPDALGYLYSKPQEIPRNWSKEWQSLRYDEVDRQLRPEARPKSDQEEENQASSNEDDPRPLHSNRKLPSSRQEQADRSEESTRRRLQNLTFLSLQNENPRAKELEL